MTPKKLPDFDHVTTQVLTLTLSSGKLTLSFHLYIMSLKQSFAS